MSFVPNSGIATIISISLSSKRLFQKLIYVNSKKSPKTAELASVYKKHTIGIKMAENSTQKI